MPRLTRPPNWPSSLQSQVPSLGLYPHPHPTHFLSSSRPLTRKGLGVFLQSPSPVPPFTRAKSLSPGSLLPWTQESRPPAPPPPDSGVWASGSLHFQEPSDLSSLGPVNSSPLTSLQPARGEEARGEEARGEEARGEEARGEEARGEDAWDQLLRAENSSDGVAWPSGSPALLNQQEHLCQDSFLSPLQVKAPAWEGQGLLAGKEGARDPPLGQGLGPLASSPLTSV